CLIWMSSPPHSTLFPYTTLFRSIRIGVIFGGRSGEHEVSVRSARSVIEAFDVERYEVVPIAITKEGRWLSPAASALLLPEETRRSEEHTSELQSLRHLVCRLLLE